MTGTPTRARGHPLYAHRRMLADIYNGVLFTWRAPVFSWPPDSQRAAKDSSRKKKVGSRRAPLLFLAVLSSSLVVVRRAPPTHPQRRDAPRATKCAHPTHSPPDTHVRVCRGYVTRGEADTDAKPKEQHTAKEREGHTRTMFTANRLPPAPQQQIKKKRRKKDE